MAASRIAVAFGLLFAAMNACADAEAVWRGNFLVGRQGAQFSPCRSGERFAVTDATPGRALEAAYRELATRPGRALYAEFRGAREARGLRATRFERAQADGPGCREDLDHVRLRAYGFNPFVQFELGERSALLRTVPSAEPDEFAGAALQVVEGEARYEGSNADSVLRLRVRARACREPLSSALFSYEAVIVVDGTPYSVCAYWGKLGPIPMLGSDPGR